VPKTRLDLDRTEKIDEIVDAARAQLVEGGYDALSMVRIAQEVGVARNAIYWYFPTRDHLFVAVLRRLVEEASARKPPSRQSVSDRAVWLVNVLADVHPLLVTMRERARASEVVAEFRDQLESLLRGMLTAFMSPHVDDVRVAVDAFWATVEGALLRQLPKRLRDAVVRFTLKSFVGEAAANAPHPS